MPTFKPFDWYEQPLYYDIIFDADTETEADFLMQVHEKHGVMRGRRLLEPACGSGRLVRAMVQRGYRVTGFDLSRAMLSFARQRLNEQKQRATLVQADMADFSFAQPFDMAHCLVSTFKYLPDDRSARAHLQCVAAALKPGGIYVLGLHLADYADEAPGRERWVAERDGVHVVCNIQGWPSDRKSRTERLRARMVATHADGTVERLESHWTFRTYDGPQLRRLLRSVPQFEHIATYDFNHRITRPIEFDGDQLDHVLILRRTAR